MRTTTKMKSRVRNVGQGVWCGVVWCGVVYKSKSPFLRSFNIII